ncbi:hypothetical protein SAMN05444972_11468 [Marininema halotolerans]|uniref:Uncharacterized protein n=2 Tax=Marininema halotolerans TaxID=1155944 RepID=A0A1I6U9E7_9BACL|nr:hypothetical protein SAMN05444972_11468 [Marininema halotolerans]
MKVICNSVGLYVEALTRGKEYEVLAEDEEKDQIKIVGDNKRGRWFKKSYFVPYGSNVAVLVKWQFGDSIHDVSEESLEHIEITVLLSDGQTRWCSVCTKAGLVDYIERNMNGNGFLIENQIVVKNLLHKTVNDALIYFDQQNELIRSTKLLSYKNR